MNKNSLLFLLLFIFLNNIVTAHAEFLPLRTDSGLTKTEALLKDGKFTAALEAADNVLKRHVNNADAYVYKGYAYYMLGETNSAKKYFKMALKLDPSHLGANEYIATIYINRGQINRALEQLQVIRMICGKTDCEELRTIESEIDKYKTRKKD